MEPERRRHIVLVDVIFDNFHFHFSTLNLWALRAAACCCVLLRALLRAAACCVPVITTASATVNSTPQHC